MKLSHALIVLLCFSLDGFVVMLRKGASLRELPLRKGAVYALIFALVDGAALTAGFLISLILRGLLSDRVEMVTAILIVFAVGVYIATRAIYDVRHEERLDRNFNEQNCMRLAVRTSIPVLLIGSGCFLLGFPLGPVLIMFMAIIFISILAALYIGYNQGSRFGNAVGILSGCLMMIFSVYLMYVYVLVPRI